MKNFKKVLALVLVLATLLGLATMASATEYKDADKIDGSYDEAIKVLDLIETMQGYPNGEFRPTANITREEAAKLIAIFDNKDSDISTYYTSINPFADEKGRWGESYVGYGYRAGIIAGMNATTFAPTANVTGTQFLKMALVTLGYDQEAEGFVGSSWAVNVLALAKRIKLIDGLNDGWKPEADLTRQEAAQILLNTLNAETVEYGQEAKSVDFAPTYVENGKYTSGKWKWDSEGYWTFKGKAYFTVAGAVKTGHPLYEDFDLENETSDDAFFRPYTKWTLDKTSVTSMKPVKASFTKQFSMCDLLVALGVKETDTKTKIAIDAVFVNGVNMINDSPFLSEEAGAEQVDSVYDKYDTEYGYTWHHEKSDCHNAKAAKEGAQGTLTQVFEVGKDDGVKHYIVCEIDTWLAKVDKVTKKTTARDEHIKGEDAVELTPYLDDAQLNENYEDWWTAFNTKLETELLRNDGKLTYDDPTGLAKKDYVLITYSFRDVDEDNESSDEFTGVQSADVVTGKEGRLNGYKFGAIATNPSETRIDGEFIKDAVHFHMGYNASKREAGNDYGTYTFFYDAYGNVIGLDEAADTSNWLVVDKAYIAFTEGEAALNVKVYDTDAKDNSTTVKKFDKVVSYLDDDSAAEYDDSLGSLAYNLAVALKELTNGEDKTDFAKLYDHLLKGTYDKDGKLTLKSSLSSDDELKNVPVAILGDDSHPYGMDKEDKADAIESNVVKVTNGTPSLKYTDDAANKEEEDWENDIVLTSKTQFLVHQMDGTYASYTGYKNVPSMIAHYAEVVFDADYKDEKVASIVYLTFDVYTTDGKFIAYIGRGADRNGAELTVDGTEYFGLTAYVDGEATDVYVSEDDMEDYFTEESFKDDEDKKYGDTFHEGFYQLQYVEVDGDKIVKVLKTVGDLTGNDEHLNITDEDLHDYKVVYNNGEELRINDSNDELEGIYELAEGYKIYGIYENKVVTDVEIGDVEKGDHVYFSVNDDGDEITALYLVIEDNQ